MNKFIDYISPEKDIIKEKFTTISYMDVWICSIIEGYIYENVKKVDEEGYKEEYMERYGKKEREYRTWYKNGQIEAQYYYKEGKKEGENKEWYENGQLGGQFFYKEGKFEGEYKMWFRNGQLGCQCYYKEGKREGEFKEWNEEGDLISYKIYKDDNVIEDLLTTP